MVIKNLLHHKSNKDAESFFAEINKFLPQLRHYIAQRLHIEERRGNLPRNFYKPDDILNDVILDIYNKITSECTEDKLRLELYRTTIEKFNSLLNREDKEKVDINKLVENELQDLQEKITVTADGEIVLTDDLDDISYHQKDFEPKYIFTDTSIEDKVLALLEKDAKQKLSDYNKQVFWKLYEVVPAQSKTIIELHIFAGLSSGDIAEIIGVKQENVNKVLLSFSEKFNKIIK